MNLLNRFLIVKDSNILVYNHKKGEKQTVQITSDLYFTSDEVMSIVDDVVRVSFPKGDYIWFEIASIELYDVTVISRRERSNAIEAGHHRKLEELKQKSGIVGKSQRINYYGSTKWDEIFNKVMKAYTKCEP